MSLAIPAGLLSRRINAYSEMGAARKHALHKDGRRFLRKLAAELGLAKGSFDVRSNKGGIAVSGEVTLHSDTLYVQLYETVCRSGVRVLYRRCRGRRDYCGEANHDADPASLQDEERMRLFVQELRMLGDLAPVPDSVRLAA